VTTLIDDTDEPIVVGRTVVVTPEPPETADPDQLDPAPLAAQLTITVSSLDIPNIGGVLLDPAPLGTTIGIATTELIDATALDPAPIAFAVDMSATALVDALLLGPATLATTITLTGELGDARALLNPAPLRLTVTTDADLTLQVAGHEATADALGIIGLPAHVYHDYDPTRLVLRRAVVVTSKLNGFIIGKSKLGTPATVWANIPAATVSINQSYTPDENGTLIIEQETASISLSYWDNPGPLLYAGDRIELWYAGELLFYGTIDSTALLYAIDSSADQYGATRRVDFSATAAGTYAVMMGRTIKWKNLPKETAIKRMRRWVTVNKF
jgi:hypothetical protein